MVGIVVVSHSREIAAGTAALAAQMAGPEVRDRGRGRRAGRRARHRRRRSWAPPSRAADQGDGVDRARRPRQRDPDRRAHVLDEREDGNGARPARRRAARRGRGRRRGRRLGRAWRSTTSRPPRRRPVPSPSSERLVVAARRRRPARAAGRAVRAHRDGLPARASPSPPASARSTRRACSPCSRSGPRRGTPLRLRADGDDAPVALDALAGCVAGLASSARRVRSAAERPAPTRGRGVAAAHAARAPTRAAPTLSSPTPRPTSSGTSGGLRRRLAADLDAISRAAAAARAVAAIAASTRGSVAAAAAPPPKRSAPSTACGEVVRADREEVRGGRDRGGGGDGRRRLDHRAER